MILAQQRARREKNRAQAIARTEPEGAMIMSTLNHDDVALARFRNKVWTCWTRRTQSRWTFLHKQQWCQLAAPVFQLCPKFSDSSTAASNKLFTWAVLWSWSQLSFDCTAWEEPQSSTAAPNTRGRWWQRPWRWNAGPSPKQTRKQTYEEVKTPLSIIYIPPPVPRLSLLTVSIMMFTAPLHSELPALHCFKVFKSPVLYSSFHISTNKEIPPPVLFDFIILF